MRKYFDSESANAIRMRRVRKTEKINGMQIMPQFTKISYWCMLLVPALVIALEIFQFCYFSRELGIMFVIGRALLSALITWVVFELMLIVASVVQIKRIRGGHVETKYVKREIGDDTDPFEPVENPEPKYFKYIKVACIGGVALLVLYGISYLIGLL